MRGGCGVLDSIDVGALLAGLSVVGAIPSLVDVGGVEYYGALAVVNGQLVVYDAFANRTECAIGDVFSIGRYDVGDENRFGQNGNGAGGGVVAETVGDNKGEEYGILSRLRGISYCGSSVVGIAVYIPLNGGGVAAGADGCEGGVIVGENRGGDA